jgi:tRNA A-37 threonylcarbamoyl transferase component Bud32
VKLRLLGVGLYREGFKVRDCDLVIKFPRQMALKSGKKSLTEGKKHSAQEIRRLRRLRQVGTLNTFLPEVFYYDKKSGVIAMKYYSKFSDFEEQADAMGGIIESLIFRLTRVRCGDIHTDNVRQDKDHAIIIDLGL